MALRGKPALELGVAAPLLRVRSERFAKRELPIPVLAAVGDDVDVVCPRLLAEEQPFREAVLAEVLVPESPHRLDVVVRDLQVAQSHQDIDDWFRVEVRDRRAADVLDAYGAPAEDRRDPLLLGLEELCPTRVMFDQFYAIRISTHHFPEPLRRRIRFARRRAGP